jgi:hypothetical protein
VSARIALAAALGLTLHAGALAALASPSSGTPASATGGARLIAARVEFDAGPRLLGLTEDGDGSLALYWSTLRPL